MKTNIYSLLAAGLVLLGAASCSDDWSPAVAEEGTVNLSSLSIDTSDAEKVMTDNLSRADVDLSSFIVTVNNGADFSRTYTYGTMPEVLTLPVGSYTLTVVSHEVQKAEWDKPLYKGSKDFTVEKGKISNIGEVVAAFSSLKVTVEFSDELKEMMYNDVKVTVTANDEGSLVFTPSETRAGFFAAVPGSTTMVAHFEGTVNGLYMSEYATFTDIEPGQHRIVRYSVKAGPDIPEESGGVDGSGITLDTSVIDKDINTGVEIEEDNIDGSDRPGQEDPVGPVDPVDPGTEAVKFEPYDSPNLNLDAVNQASEDFGNAIVKISAEKGIKNLVVTIESDNSTFMYTLSDMKFDKPFDLANITDTELEGFVSDLKLPYNSQVLGQPSVNFNITEFVPWLLPFSGNHSFTIEVTDAEGNSSSKKLLFNS